MDNQLNDLRRRAGIVVIEDNHFDSLLNESVLNEALIQDTIKFFSNIIEVLRKLRTIHDNPSMLRTLALRNLEELREVSENIQNDDLRQKMIRFINNRYLLSKDYGRMAYVTSILNMSVRFGISIDPNSEFSALFINQMLDWAADAMGISLPNLLMTSLARTPAVIAGFRTFFNRFNTKLDQVIAANTP